jgi:hypothetical protein
MVMTRVFPSGVSARDAVVVVKPGAPTSRMRGYATAFRIRTCFRKLQLQLADLEADDAWAQPDHEEAAAGC